MNIDRNPATVVADRNGIIGVDFDSHIVRVFCQSLVDPVIDNLIDHMVQARAIIGVTDIHARALPDGLQAFENFNRIRAILLGVLRVVAHMLRSLILSGIYTFCDGECHVNGAKNWAENCG